MNYDELWIINVNNAGEIHSFKFQMFRKEPLLHAANKVAAATSVEAVVSLGSWEFEFQWFSGT